jgi:hypothetical protein
MILRSLDTKRLLVIILFLSIFVMATQGIGDPDFFWHLRTGQLIWERRSIPREDPFSYTARGQAWVAHEWLTETILFALYSLIGQKGLILAFALLITCTFILVYLQCEGRPWLATFVVLLASLTSAISWGVRPQMISLFLSALFLYILTRKESRLWLLPPLMALWVNLHGGYLLGLALLLLHIMGEGVSLLKAPQGERRHLKKLSFIFLLSGGFTLINPHGWRILSYPFATLGSQAMQAYIIEWFSPDFHQAQFQPLAILILVTWLTLFFSRAPRHPRDILFLLAFGYAALRSARNVPLFAVVAAPILSKQLASLWEGSWLQRRLSQKGQRRPNLHLCALNWFLLLIILSAGSFKVALALKENESLQRRIFPVAAVDYIEQQDLRGNIYNLYQWGGYLIWRLYPKEDVFIDGRADVYGDKFIEEYLEVYRVRKGWRDVLERYNVNSIIIEKDSTFATLLAESPDWQQVYADELAVVFVRK